MMAAEFSCSWPRWTDLGTCGMATDGIVDITMSEAGGGHIGGGSSGEAIVG